MPFGELVTLDDLVIRDFAMLGAYFGVMNPLVIGLVQEVKMDFGPLFGFGVDSLDREGHQPESQLALPTSAILGPPLRFLLGMFHCHCE